MTSSVTLSVATSADRDALIDLKHQMNLSEHHWRTLARDRSADDLNISIEAANGPIERDFSALTSGNGGIILARIDEKAVGYVSFVVKQSSTSFREEARTFLYVSALAVDAAHRNAGIGLILLEAADSEARLRGINKVMLDVSVISPAVRFYEKAGFTPVSHNMIKRLD